MTRSVLKGTDFLNWHEQKFLLFDFNFSVQKPNLKIWRIPKNARNYRINYYLAMSYIRCCPQCYRTYAKDCGGCKLKSDFKHFGFSYFSIFLI